MDWNGVHYDLPELRKEGLSPGESRPGLFTMYQLHGMQDSTKKGKVTFFFLRFLKIRKHHG